MADSVKDIQEGETFVLLHKNHEYSGLLMLKISETTAYIMEHIEFNMLIWSENEIEVDPNASVRAVSLEQFRKR